MKILLPDKVKSIIKTLNNNGFEAFAVGGCVRDSLLSIIPNDWDICTSAKPEKIKECFKDFNTFDVGIKHGTISVVIEDEIFDEILDAVEEAMDDYEVIVLNLND